MIRRSPVLGIFLLISIVCHVDSLRSQDGLDSQQLAFFEKNIRPVLVAECYSCHSSEAKEIEGGLSLDTREGIRKGGDTGPSIVPGSVRRSLLIRAIGYKDDDLQMPPEKKLSSEVIANFERWVEMGAADPRDGQSIFVEPSIDIEQGRRFWSFQTPIKKSPPNVKDSAWPRSAIDRFVLAGLEAEGLRPVPDAEPHSLIRRLYFDLIGLPPTPEQVREFVREHAADPQAALDSAADRLLESPAFGERWGRHWLDVARYAESSGGSSNLTYPHAWRYRDYVVDAFNADKPYDQFIREQLAGDLLDADNAQEEAQNMVATGFLAIGGKSHNERNRRQFLMDLVDEQINATFSAFQGLTVACARCHDHKFDPIPQTDYYALAGIFQSTETCYGTLRGIQSNHPSPLLELPRDGNPTISNQPLTTARRAAIETQMDGLRQRMSEMTDRESFVQRRFIASRIAQLQSQLDLYDDDGAAKAMAMGVRERRFTFDSPLFIRGEIDQPASRVRRGFPRVLTTNQPRIRFRSSGRLELADWIASSENPLTARVMVNRIWLHLLGRGIVPTPDNFGAAGLPPSHPELLDYLAVSFMENGWSIKRLIRSIVTSRVYQLSSDMDHDNFEADPENSLVWRVPTRRLEIEALRDTMLMLCDRLKLTPKTGSSVSISGEGNANILLRGNSIAFDRHRTIYLPIVRDQLPELLLIFDFPDPSLIIGERPATTIPSQALFLMNSSFVIRQTETLAVQILESIEQDTERLKHVYELCYSRPPSDSEMNNALKFIDDYEQSHSQRATWAALCQAMFASAEFAQR